MKSFIPYSLIAAALSCGFASAQTPTTAYTTPVGYTSVTCLNASDTRVGTPLKAPTVAAAALTATPTNVLTVAGAAFGTYAGNHYVKFTSGAAIGKVYAITANDATTITIDLAGDTQLAVSGDTFSVTAFWTLATLFDPALSTNDPLTTGNAIVSSAGATAATRRTEILLPDTVTAGINLASSASYYINAGIWKKAGSGATNFNAQQLWPDTSFIIRHPATVTSPTSYVCTGEVDMKSIVIPLATRVGGATEKQDNAQALNRPVNVTLNQLNLGGTSAFVSSTGATAATRRDELLVYDNATAAINKSSSATYYFRGAIWQKAGGGVTDVGNDVIPAGAGILIRKYGTAGGETAFWLNTPTY
jgi:uncharacterized protein (TIGR02597 family)